MNPWVAIGVFVLSAITDVVWGRYTRTMAQLEYRACFWAVGIIAVGAVGFTVYKIDIWYCVPTGGGSALGTGLAVWWGRRDRRRRAAREAGETDR